MSHLLPQFPCLFLALLCASVSLSAATGTGPWSLQHLHKAHPRLFLTPEREAQMRLPDWEDPHLALLREELRQAADWALTQPVVRYTLIGPRLLPQSRGCLARVATLALAYRLFHDERYAQRAERELAAAAALPDWHPEHFLDTAELCAAVAIGYDWLYDWLTPAQRTLIRAALVEKGLRPGLDDRYREFAEKTNNWNPVCNGGLVLGALAIADKEPEWAERLLPLMAASLPKALREYAPDGAWQEGPAYWKYGTTYLALLLDGLQTALGTDGGLSQYPGLAESGGFFRDAIGPTWKAFNFADSAVWPGTSPTLYWLARRYDRPELADFEWRLRRRFILQLEQRSRPEQIKRSETETRLDSAAMGDLIYSNWFYAFELVWYQRSRPLAAPRPNPSTRFHGIADVAMLRGDWHDPQAFFLAIKGAGRPNHHAHLDAGSFVLDALGERWAEDLGPDDYDLPGYFDMSPEGKRWTYFRLGSLSHNVVTINGRDQKVGCVAHITKFYAGAGRAHAVLDLDDAYEGQVAKARRGAAMLNPRTMLVQDELTGLHTGDDARWALLTSAHVDLDGAVAHLTLNGQALRAQILAPAGARWQIESAQPKNKTEAPNPGRELLTLHVHLTAGATSRIAVVFTPESEPETTTPVLPLARWQDGQPLPCPVKMR